MEFSSGEGYHISRLARLYRGIEFWASEADLWSCENLRSLTSAATGLEDGATSSLETVGGRGDGKVERIVQLDFLVAEQWDSLIAALAPSRSLSDTGAQVGEAGKDHGMELGEESKLSGIWGINFLHMIPLYVFLSLPLYPPSLCASLDPLLLCTDSERRTTFAHAETEFQSSRTRSDLLPSLERITEGRLRDLLRTFQAG